MASDSGERVITLTLTEMQVRDLLTSHQGYCRLTASPTASPYASPLAEVLRAALASANGGSGVSTDDDDGIVTGR